MTHLMSHRRRWLVPCLVTGTTFFFFASAALVGWRSLSGSRPAAASAHATLVVVRPASISIEGLKGETLRHRVRLENVSTRALRLTALTPSCECTDVKLKKAQLAPGEVTDAELTIETAGRPESFIVAAPFEATAVDRSERVVAEVSLVVRGDLGLSDDVIDFGTVRGGGGAKSLPIERISRSFEIRLPAVNAASGWRCEVTDAPKEPFLGVELAEASQAHERLVCRGTAELNRRGATAKDPGFFTSATIDVKGPDGALSRRFVIRLVGRVVQRVASNPSVLYWSKEGLSATQQLAVISDDGERFRILQVDCDEPELVVWDLLQTEGPRGTVAVTPNDRARSPGILRSRLRLTIEFDGGPPEDVFVPILIL